MMDEHYSYNNLREDNELPYFRHEISKHTCEYKWEDEINAFFFKTGTVANRAIYFVHKLFCPSFYGR
jgi:hypothetical protein